MDPDLKCMVCDATGVACPSTDFPISIPAPKAPAEQQPANYLVNVTVGFSIPGQACGHIPILCEDCYGQLLSGLVNFTPPPSPLSPP